MKWILRLYPAEFQRRYRTEMEAQLSADLPRFRTALDLMAGAVDAWRNRDLVSQHLPTEGDYDMITASRTSEYYGITTADGRKFVILTIAYTLLFVAIGVLLDKTLGDNAIAGALMFSSWLFGAALASRNTFLKPYSVQARNVITSAALSTAFLVFLVVFILLQA